MAYAVISEHYTVSFDRPSLEEFSGLRYKVGWGETDPQMAEQSLNNSLFHIVIRDHGQLLAMGRVIGDGALYFYVQDVAVDPNYQKQGLGDAIMKNIEDYLKSTAKKGSTIGLLAAAGNEGFYLRYGYIERSGKPLGKGMCKFV